MDLNGRLASWVDEITSGMLGAIEQEIDNRIGPYSALRAILIQDSIDVADFYKRARQCTLMTDLNKYAKTPVDSFFEDETLSRRIITRLVQRMPSSECLVSKTIDSVIEEAASKSGLQKHQATILVSLVLTAAHPQRFVDFPAYAGWENFAKRLVYGLPYETSHGDRIAWASEFAREIARTEVFQEHYGAEHNEHPMWIVSALCWANRNWEISRQ